MSVYITNIRTALFLFPLFIVPIGVLATLVQYRRYGRAVIWRTSVIYAFTFFILAAYALTMLPLPELTPDLCDIYSGVRPYWTPFRMFPNIWADYQARGSLISTLTGGVFLQVFFNFLLLMPLGFFLRYLFEMRFRTVFLLSLLMSLSFEITQLTAIYGLYPCPFRVFEVDDLILNTGGSLVGYALLPLLAFLPDVTPEPVMADPALPISRLRRALALFVDVQLASLIWGLLTIRVALAETLQLPFIMLILVVSAILTRGNTVGLWLTRLRLKNANGASLAWWQPIVRYGVLFGLPLLYVWLLTVTTNAQFIEQLPQPLLPVLGFMLIASSALLPLAFILPLFIRKDRRTLHELLSQTKVS